MPPPRSKRKTSAAASPTQHIHKQRRHGTAIHEFPTAQPVRSASPSNDHFLVPENQIENRILEDDVAVHLASVIGIDEETGSQLQEQSGSLAPDGLKDPGAAAGGAEANRANSIVKKGEARTRIDGAESGDRKHTGRANEQNGTSVSEPEDSGYSCGEEEQGDESDHDTSSGSGSGSASDDGETERKGQGAAGFTAFGRAYSKIMNKKLQHSSLTDAMGPVLSAHKQLITKKLKEAATDRKAKSQSKKEKQAFREKGHTIPVVYIDAKEKSLIKLATKGVVKLFNAVSKAQSIQEAAKVSKTSEAKAVAKQSKSTFLAELQGGCAPASNNMKTQQTGTHSNLKKEEVNGHRPGWSALQDTFMLGKSRLKDWDKKEDAEADSQSEESSDGGRFSG